jgi:hypothetical protein
METLKDCQGKTSSKRIAGFASLIFLAGLTVFCLLKTPNYIADFLWAWVPIILVLFGATSIEKFANLRDTRKRTENPAFPPYNAEHLEEAKAEEEEFLKKEYVKKVSNAL